MRITPMHVAVAGICGGLALALSFTPLGYVRVPNLSGSATTLHIPAIVAGVVTGPLAGALVGLVLAFTSWFQFQAIFVQFAGGNLAVALAAELVVLYPAGSVADSSPAACERSSSSFSRRFDEAAWDRRRATPTDRSSASSATPCSSSWNDASTTVRFMTTSQ